MGEVYRARDPRIGRDVAMSRCRHEAPTCALRVPSQQPEPFRAGGAHCPAEHAPAHHGAFFFVRLSLPKSTERMLKGDVKYRFVIDMASLS
jgi:hypothetical protein